MNNEIIKTRKFVARTLVLIQGIITAGIAIAVMYGIITSQF
jgi:hypothetical protein